MCDGTRARIRHATAVRAHAAAMADGAAALAMTIQSSDSLTARLTFAIRSLPLAHGFAADWTGVAGVVCRALVVRGCANAAMPQRSLGRSAAPLFAQWSLVRRCAPAPLRAAGCVRVRVRFASLFLFSRVRLSRLVVLFQGRYVRIAREWPIGLRLAAQERAAAVRARVRRHPT